MEPALLTAEEGRQPGHNQRLLFGKGAEKMRREAGCAQLHLEGEGRGEGADRPGAATLPVVTGRTWAPGVALSPGLPSPVVTVQLT